MDLEESYWTLTHANLFPHQGTSIEVGSSEIKILHASVGDAFECHTNIEVPLDDKRQAMVNFEGFKIQPYGVEKDHFGHGKGVLMGAVLGTPYSFL